MVSALFEQARQTYERRHAIARDWKKKGKLVFGYVYSFVPEELIYAVGALPVQIMESDEKSAMVASRALLPDFYCDFEHSLLGQGLDGVYNYLDGIVIPDACATLRDIAELWRALVKTPYFHYFTPPMEATTGAKTYYKAELGRFRRSLEEYCGAPITDESLRSAIQVYNENRRLLKKLYDLRLEDKLPVSGSQVIDVVKAGLVMPKDEHNQMLRGLLDQLSDQTGDSEGRARLFLSMLIFEDCASRRLNVAQMVEEAGADVVLDDLCMGLRYFWEPVEPRGDLMNALVDRYVARIPGPFRYPHDARGRMLLGEAQKYRVKGAIFMIPMHCESYLYQYPYLEGKFREQGIPTLLVETTESLGAAQVKTRVEAFLEMLGETVT